jgi:lysophospholipase L1-like esterase
MYRKLGVLTVGALSLIGCGSDAETPGNAMPGLGGAPQGGAAGNVGVVVPGGGGMTVTPGGGGTPVGPSGNGGTVVTGTGTGGIGMAGTTPGGGGSVQTGMGGAGNGGAAPGGAAGMPMGGTAGQSMGGAAGAAGGGEGGSGAAAAFKPPCLKKPSQVVFLGDSYVNYAFAHPELNGLVAQRAIMDGALMTGQNYRDYAVAGATMAAASLNMIPPQWPSAKSADPDIKVVIMTGGGNDVLINNPQCKAAGSQNNMTCQQVVADTVMTVGNLIADFQKAGVADLIYFFYPHVPAGGADIADYAMIRLNNSAKLLSTDKFRMQVIDLVPVFNGHADWIAGDGIHANATGEGKIADEIYKVMKNTCVAQPASKGCCVP